MRFFAHLLQVGAFRYECVVSCCRSGVRDAGGRQRPLDQLQHFVDGRRVSTSTAAMAGQLSATRDVTFEPRAVRHLSPPTTMTMTSCGPMPMNSAVSGRSHVPSEYCQQAAPAVAQQRQVRAAATYRAQSVRFSPHAGAGRFSAGHVSRCKTATLSVRESGNQ